MEHSPICPNCLSKYHDIPGLLYGPGQVVGTKCDDIWHKGWNYDPNKWVLTPFDQEFLAEQKVSAR
jgi:hypothetical protein